jgi:hypothetical protein
MATMLYNPAVEQRVVLLDQDGEAFSSAAAGRGSSWSERGISLEKLLSNGWRVVSVTPAAEGSGMAFLLVLERRVRDRHRSKAT